MPLRAIKRNIASLDRIVVIASAYVTDENQGSLKEQDDFVEFLRAVLPNDKDHLIWTLKDIDPHLENGIRIKSRSYRN